MEGVAKKAVECVAAAEAAMAVKRAVATAAVAAVTLAAADEAEGWKEATLAAAQQTEASKAEVAMLSATQVPEKAAPAP